MQVSRITLTFQDYIAGSMLVPIIETGNTGKSPVLSRRPQVQMLSLRCL